jgi:ribosomal protein L29
MNKKERVEILSKSEGELTVLLKKYKEEINKSVLDKYSAKAKKNNKIGTNKRQIARILTILRIKKGEKK